MNESSGTSSELPGGTESILLAEDDDVLRATVRKPLEALGYTVYLARDGEEAVDLFRAHASEIDLVIVSVRLPKLSGTEVWAIVKSESPQVKMLFTSGYLPKPWELPQLASTIRRILDSPDPLT
jgi:CheY-like chemotaxis protein